MRLCIHVRLTYFYTVVVELLHVRKFYFCLVYYANVISSDSLLMLHQKSFPLDWVSRHFLKLFCTYKKREHHFLSRNLSLLDYRESRHVSHYSRTDRAS